MIIQTEIPDINREEVIEAVARQLLTEWREEYDEAGPYSRQVPTRFGAALKKYLDTKIEELAQTLVREKFDEAIGARIYSAVDEVMREGWQVTDNYGCPTGQKLDLKGRINKILTERDRWDSNRSFVEVKIKKAVEEALSGEFKKEVEAAVASLRKQLDAVVSGKFTEAIKSALGIR